MNMKSMAFIFTSMFTTVYSNFLTPEFAICVAELRFPERNSTHESVCKVFDGILRKECEIFTTTHSISNSIEECEQYKRTNLRANVDNHFVSFTDFLIDFDRRYNSIENLVDRFYIFKDNMEYALEENTKGNSYILGITKFMDLTHSEYKDLLNPLDFSLPKNYCKSKSLSGSFPSGVDWREKGAVTPVKNQGSSGTCYSFSTTAAIEGAYVISGHPLTSFSEQQIVDCSKNYGNLGVNGGMMTYSFSYVMDYGITTEQAYPYTSGTSGKAGTCQSFTPVTKLSSCSEIPANELQLTLAIAKQPVSVAIEADKRSFQMYTSGIYNDPNCGTNLDHGVAAVGYGTQNEQDYYIVRNSWGTSWGESGYIRIARNSVSTSTNGICGIAMEASYPTI